MTATAYSSPFFFSGSLCMKENTMLVRVLAITIALTVSLSRLSMAVGEICNGIALAIGIYLFYKMRKTVHIPKKTKGYLKAYTVFVLSTLPATLLTGNITVGMHEFLQMWLWRFCPFLLILLFIRKRHYLINMLTLFTAAFGIDCFVTLIQVVYHLGNNDRGWGLGGSQLGIAGLICMMLPFVLVMLYEPSIEKRLKCISLITLFCIIIALFCNKSRGAWLTCLITLPLTASHYLIRQKKKIVLSLLLLLVFGGIMISQPEYNARFRSITNTTTDRSNSDRIWTWASSLDMFEDRPLTGVGLGQFRFHYDNGYRYAQETQHLSHAHNNFFHLLAETGIIGFLGLLYWLSYFLCASLKAYHKKKNPYDLLIFTTVLSYVILFGQVEYTLDMSANMRIFWFLLGCLLLV